MTDKVGVVNIFGKDYQTVALRVHEFREKHGNELSIETQLIMQDELKVIMKALIMDGERLISTGYAEEIRGSSDVNTTSALENAETSAIGRALASFGLPGTEYASADEASQALIQQQEKHLFTEWAEFTQYVEEYHESLVAIRNFLVEDNFDAAREAWNEIDNDDKMILWRATTKGGWFSPRERQQMKWWSNDFETSRKDSKGELAD